MKKLLVVTALLFSSACGGRVPPPAELRPSSDALSPLEWMSGYWVGERDGRPTEEYWSWPAGGTMIGMNRTLGGSGGVKIEHMRIERRDDGTFLVREPAGAEKGEFKLVAMPAEGEDRAVFERSGDAYPKRVDYRLYEGELHVRIEGGPGERTVEWTWQRSEVE